jgi:hypothetical protein
MAAASRTLGDELLNATLARDKENAAFKRLQKKKEKEEKRLQE